MKQSAVFLDRDGVINELILRAGVPRAPYELDELRLLPGVQEAVRDLKAAGFIPVIVTNQPDAVRGWVTIEQIEAVNRKICQELGIFHIKVCYHDRKDACPCRKPRPGMLTSAAHELGLNLAKSYMIGDRYSDVLAGTSAGCKTILIGPGDAGAEMVEPTFRARDLLEASRLILRNN